MRRDYFTLDVDAGNGQPTVTVRFTGPAAAFEDRLGEYEDVSGADIDISYRLLGERMAEGEPGVFGLSDRVTGEFLLECNVDADRITTLVEAATISNEEGVEAGEGRYRLVVEVDEGPTWELDMAAILVYDSDGNVLRQHSLIPSGVEL